MMSRRNPTVNGLLQEYDDVVYIPFSVANLILGVTMSGGFMLCVVLAMIYNFDASTWTHCRVPNYLPSLSAAISIPPSAYVWRFIVAVSASPRIYTVAFHYRHYAGVGVPSRQYRRLCQLCFASELLENICLVGLTCVTSTENHGLHAIFFTGFQLCAMIFMLLMCIVYQQAAPYEDYNYTQEQQKSSQRRKWVVLFINYGVFFSAMYFYYRHNTYCEPGVYTIFALLEYFIVLSNMAFHMIVTQDFSNRELQFGAKATSKIS